MILAAFSSCCCYEFWLHFFLLLQKLLLLLLLVPGCENTMAVKDGEAPKLYPENAYFFILLLL